MYVDIRDLLLFSHIFFAIIWVGGVLFVGWGVLPVIKLVGLVELRMFLITLMKRNHLLFSMAGLGVIITGILLGTAFGPIYHWDQIWNTDYGMLWFYALFTALATLLWGSLVGYRQMMNVLKDDPLWSMAEKGVQKPLILAIIRAAAVESIEVFGFIALLFIMIKF